MIAPADDLVPFSTFPSEVHLRKHGPGGYRHYGEYLAWIRDEFTFRCVYCLTRERWESHFTIDHLQPQSLAPDGAADYGNLVYACQTCNAAKSGVPLLLDPCKEAFGEHLRLTPDGVIHGLTPQGRIVVRLLRSNRDRVLDARKRWLRVLSFLLTGLDSEAQALARHYLSFPDDLPDLAIKRPPWNTRAEGVAECYFALRLRGNLPETYL